MVIEMISEVADLGYNMSPQKIRPGNPERIVKGTRVKD